MHSVATLTMNPAVDICTQVDRVLPTHKLRCQAARRDAGGGGINVARVIQRLGGEVAAIFPAGGAAGDWLVRRVQQEGVKSWAIAIAGETRENFTAVETSTNQQFKFVLPGPLLSGLEQEACLSALAELQPKPAFVVASGSLPPGMSELFYARIAAASRGLGAKLIVDTSGADLAHALKEKLFLIKPSLSELRHLTGALLEDETSWIEACRRLVRTGATQAVALTLGAEGALLTTQDGVWRAPPLPVQAVSTIGAGDSFLGGMVWGLAQGQTLTDAFVYGVAAGSATLLAAGTELCRPDDVWRLAAAVRIESVGHSSSRRRRLKTSSPPSPSARPPAAGVG